VGGKSTKSRADQAADTVTSPLAPAYGAQRAPDVHVQRSGLELGARSSERAVVGANAKGQGRCLIRNDVVVYLGPACPKDVKARVDTHAAECVSCRQWIRHLDDEILEYIGGQRSEAELAQMDAHLDACTPCRDLVHHVVQGMAQSWPGAAHDTPDGGTTFAPGNVVNGRYLVRSFVGRGGMGEVYEAFDRLMDRRIALKTVLCTVADRPRAARRFKEEVRNAQRVGHPNVCRINDLQEHHESALGPPLPFFTMEFVDGDRLANRVLKGKLPLADVRTIALQLLSGLDAAHARGVLHLDFKSDNVMLRRGPKPDAVIMDFGLSRVLGHESRLRTSDRRQFAGTLPYMSVEQLECREELGPATDIYAFGVVLYELLTRALPFEGDTLSAVLVKQLKERPKPPSRLVPGLSPALDRFVLRCLHRDPRQRFADAGHALAALSSIGDWSRLDGRSKISRTVVPLVAIAVVAAVVAASGRREAEPVVAEPAARDEPELQQVTRALAPSAPAHEALPEPPHEAPPALLEAGSPPPAAPPHEAAAAAQPLPAANPGIAARAPHRTALEPGVAAPASAAGAPAEPVPTLPAASAAVAGAVAAPATSAPARSTSATPAAKAPVPTPASGAAASDPAWKPERVPKRLSVPAASGAAPDPAR
jgi:hypothetical protein